MSEKVAARVKVSEPKRASQPVRQTPVAPVRPVVASPVNRIQTLQRTAGNQAVLGMIRSGAIQLKPGGPLFSGGQPAPEGFGMLLNSPGPGAGLPSHIQNNLETSLGVPMDPVRVHTDKRANSAADGIGARAFTYGTNIFLGSRERPTDLGLMAHEAAHVVQQTGAPIVQRKAGSDSSEALEREADRVAAAAQRGESASVDGRTGVVQPQFWSIRGAIGAVGRGISSAASAVADVAGNIIERAVNFIKERARSIPGYDLLGFILGRDPLTQQPMERTATNLLKGLLGLVPGGAAMFENLQKAGVIERAYSWVMGELEKLNITWAFIRGAIDRFLSTLGAADLLNLGGVFERARAIFGPIVSRIGSFAAAVGKKILEFIFEGAMALAGGAGQRIINIFRRIGATFSLILSDPIKFLSNLIGAVKGGFQRFANNILEHLKAALFEWLFGALAGAGLTLPQKWDLKGIMSLVLQVLGLTYARLRGKLVRLIGEPAVAFIEKAFEFLRIVVTQGLAAAWEKIVEFATGLVDTVLDGIKNWVITSIVKSAVTKIATMFNPVGAIINAIITIYNTIMFVIERAKQLAAFVESVINSITNIAEGKISAAVAYVEGTLARILPLAISFLARLLGLGGISETIRNIIKRIQDPVDKALDKIVGWVADKAKGLVAKGKEAVKTGVEKIKGMIFPKKTLKIGKNTHSAEAVTSSKGYEIVLHSERMTFDEFTDFARKEGKQSPNIITEANALDTIYKKWIVMPTATEPDRQKKGDAYQQILQRAELLWAKLPNVDNVPVSVIRWTSDEGRASGVKADPLTVKGVAGSEPQEPITGWYSTTLEGFPNIESLQKNSRIRAHLLHHKLGGPGRAFNLTPTSHILNRVKMYPKAEEPALRALGILDNKPKSRQLVYETKVEYDKKQPYPLNYIAKRVIVNCTDKATNEVISKFNEENYTDAEGTEMSKQLRKLNT